MFVYVVVLFYLVLVYGMDRLLKMTWYNNKVAELVKKEYWLKYIKWLDDWELNNIIDIIEEQIDEQTAIKYNTFSFL